MSTVDELVTIVDEENQPVGSASRAVMRRFNLPHRATYILVFNSRREIFIQKRTATKDIYPGYFCTATGGVVAAGESYEESAQRELAEELGVRDIPLATLFDFFFAEESNKVWGRAFSCVYDGEMVLQEEEIAYGAFHQVAEVFRLAEREPFTPDCLYVLHRYLQSRSS